VPATKNERFYIALHASKKIVLRNIMRKRAGKTEPMIQVEILDNSKRMPMVRCDRTQQHGLHIDWYNKEGKK